MADMILTVDALLTGAPTLIAPGVHSAIGKTRRSHGVRIGWLGLEGDHQADPVHHGGHDKAVHLFPQEHYHWWRGPLGDHRLLEQPGAFGENLATRGATEDELCIGDRFTLGSAIWEVSHGRQPCSKLNLRFSQPDVLACAVQSGRCGLYLRVIREGEVQARDVMTRTERPLPDWPVSRVFSLLIQGGYKKDPAGTAALATMPLLAEAWRSRAIAFAR
jgi:MOSC domain-containing protein YiiM